MHSSQHKIVRVESAEALDAVRRLFLEYARSLDFNLCFQDFDAELRSLPGDYAPPQGAILLALDGDEEIGCVAMRRIDAETCEMKRLYVKPSRRGGGVGKNLAEGIIRIARETGYRSMKLDTVPDMAEANALYHSLGFAPTEPYRFNPIEGALYLELILD
jgi:ribosomal protein S18 acetylase RimI-like enzyme